jgi:hypothetical protein
MAVVGVSSCVLGSTQGCSWLFVQPVPPGGSRGVVTCTTNRAAPVIDTIFTTTNLASVVYVASKDDGTDKGAPIMLGLSVAGLWLASAVYGYQHTAECEAEEEKYDEDYELPRARPRRYRPAPPPRRAAPPAAPAPYDAPPPPPPPPAEAAPAAVPGSIAPDAAPGPADAAPPPAAPPKPAPPARPAVPQRADDE